MSFLDGFARGMQLATQAVQMREGIEDRRRQKEWDAEDRVTRKATEARTADLQGLQLEQARRDSEQAKRVAEADQRIQAAGKLTMQTEFAPGKKEGELDQVFTVGQQRFTNREAALQAVEAGNSPLAIARRQYAAAQEIGIPDVAKKYLDNYNATRTATEAEFKQDFNNAMREGGVDGVIQLYNSKVKDGRQLVAQRGPGGKLMIGTYVDGKLQGDVVPYDNEQQFLAEQVARYAASPDAYLDSYHKTAARAEGIRQFNTNMGLQRDQLTETVRSNQAREGISQAGVNAQLAGVNVQRDALNKPTVQILPTVTTGTDGVQSTTYNAGIIRPDARPGQQVQLVPMGSAPGVRNPAKPDALASLLAGKAGAPGAGKTPGFQIDDNGLMRLDAMLNKPGTP